MEGWRTFLTQTVVMYHITYGVKGKAVRHLAKCLGCGGEDEEGEDRGQELEDVQLDGGDAGRRAARRSRYIAHVVGLSPGAMEPNASQQHSLV